MADYLCKQFYSPHYNLRQRMDMLEVVTGAVNVLDHGAEWRGGGQRVACNNGTKIVKKFVTNWFYYTWDMGSGSDLRACVCV